MAGRIVVCLCVLAMAVPCLGDDLNPPPWRKDDGVTRQEWDFLSNNPTPPPNMLVNPYGIPQAQVWPGAGQAWWGEWGDRLGVWPLSGAMEFRIPNRPEPLPYKDIWVQITWAPQAPDTYPVVTEVISGTHGSVVGEIGLEETFEEPPAGAFWYHTTFAMRLMPNPDVEVVRIDGLIMVDQVVIDTICAPEPGMLVLLGLGAAGALLRRKRS